SSALTQEVKPEISSNAIKPMIALPSQQSTLEVPVPEVVETVEAPLNIAVTETMVSEQVPTKVVLEKLDETFSVDPEPGMAEEPVEKVVPVIVESVNPVVSDSSGIVLKLTGKSWIEVRDSTGTFRLNSLFNAGTEKTFGGEPPYRVLIGNAAKARLMVNGVAFDLENHSKANVARFTLDPSAL
ncbi:MAG: DUF4115 domain-containing protein, partial [Gammaproteobacteria bacterium]|nr:DUF4115 domain-containing protein [Gammaproteobacteria bacterium]